MKLLRIYFCFGCLIIVAYSCVYNDLNPSADELVINLRWVQSYREESVNDVVTGLKWGLSFLGAELKKGSLADVIVWKSDTRLELNLSKAGFSNDAEKSLIKLLTVFKESDEYRLFEAIDIGRFIVLTLNSTHHYYAITNAHDKLDDFRAMYPFDSKKFAVTKSSVAFGHRVIELPTSADWDKIAFIASEGEGEIDQGTFQVQEFEILTLMPNGQLRFALYDSKGMLKLSASSQLTTAGKPAKCLWCHEISLQVLHSIPSSVDGFYSPEEFVLKIHDLNMAIKKYRSVLNGEIDFTKAQEHTLLELLYIGFMEPSPYRLANEWNLPVSSVEETLGELPTHQHGEFPFLGDKLYYRADADPFSPFLQLQVPEDARELSSYEPDWIGF